MAKTEFKIHPVGGKILVLAEKVEEQTKSGIFLPETASKEKPQRGKVVKLGKGKRAKNGTVIPFEIQEGDIVVFKKYSPDIIEIDDQEYLIMEEEDILAVVK